MGSLQNHLVFMLYFDCTKENLNKEHKKYSLNYSLGQILGKKGEYWFFSDKVVLQDKLRKLRYMAETHCFFIVLCEINDEDYSLFCSKQCVSAISLSFLSLSCSTTLSEKDQYSPFFT